VRARQSRRQPVRAEQRRLERAGRGAHRAGRPRDVRRLRGALGPDVLAEKALLGERAGEIDRARRGGERAAAPRRKQALAQGAQERLERRVGHERVLDQREQHRMRERLQRHAVHRRIAKQRGEPRV
jgi:hypothetical protein